jgi:septal ring factor EnvC (AmiA/AmiB activator)
MTFRISPGPARDSLAWAIAIVAIGTAIALCAATFLRDRHAAVATEAQIRDQEQIIRQLNEEILRLQHDITGMQAGIRDMQQEIIRLRTQKP